MHTVKYDKEFSHATFWHTVQLQNLSTHNLSLSFVRPSVRPSVRAVRPSVRPSVGWAIAVCPAIAGSVLSRDKKNAIEK